MSEWKPGDLIEPIDDTNWRNKDKSILLLELVSEGKSGLQKWKADVIIDGKHIEEMVLLDNPNESSFRLVVRSKD